MRSLTGQGGKTHCPVSLIHPTILTIIYKMSMKNNVIVVSGFSGAGKGTVCEYAIERLNSKAELVLSVTTRAPRHNKEKYNFITKDQFEQMEKKNLLLELNHYANGSWYGTPLDEVERILNNGITPILEIDINGCRKVRQATILPCDIFSCFIYVDAHTLYNRLIQRNTESKQEIIKRMEQSLKEAECMTEYDMLIENRDIIVAGQKLIDFIQNPQKRSVTCTQIIDTYIREMTEIIKIIVSAK